MPEHAQFPLAIFLVPDRFDGTVDAEKLMIPCQDFPGLTGRVVKDDKVLHQVHEIPFFAHPFEECLHIHHARLGFLQASPFVKVLPPAGDRSDSGLVAVTEHNDRIVMEQMRYRVLVV